MYNEDKEVPINPFYLIDNYRGMYMQALRRNHLNLDTLNMHACFINGYKMVLAILSKHIWSLKDNGISKYTIDDLLSIVLQ